MYEALASILDIELERKQREKRGRREIKGKEEREERVRKWKRALKHMLCKEVTF